MPLWADVLKLGDREYENISNWKCASKESGKQ